jgi:hypothetical protein
MTLRRLKGLKAAISRESVEDLFMPTGTDKFLNGDKGFGFITPENGGAYVVFSIRRGEVKHLLTIRTSGV